MTGALPLEHVLDYAIRLSSRTIDVPVIDNKGMTDSSLPRPIFHNTFPLDSPVNNLKKQHQGANFTPPHSPLDTKSKIASMKLAPNKNDTIPNSPLSPRRRFGRWAVVSLTKNNMIDDDPFEDELLRMEAMKSPDITTLLEARRCRTPTPTSSSRTPSTPRSVNPKQFFSLHSPPTTMSRARKSYVVSPDNTVSSKHRRSGSLPRSLMKQNGEYQETITKRISRSKYLRQEPPPPPPSSLPPAESSSPKSRAKDGRRATIHSHSHHRHKHHHDHRQSSRWYEGDERMSTKSSFSARTAGNDMTTSTISSEPRSGAVARRGDKHNDTWQTECLGSLSFHEEANVDDAQSPSFGGERQVLIHKAPTKRSTHQRPQVHHRDRRNSHKKKLDGLTGSSHHSKGSPSSHKSPISSPKSRKRVDRGRESLPDSSYHSHVSSSNGTPPRILSSQTSPSVNFNNTGTSQCVHSGSKMSSTTLESDLCLQEHSHKHASPRRRGSAAPRRNGRQVRRSSLEKPGVLSLCDKLKSTPPRFIEPAQKDHSSSSRSRKDRRRRSRTPSARSKSRSRRGSDTRKESSSTSKPIDADLVGTGAKSNALLKEIRALYSMDNGDGARNPAN